MNPATSSVAYTDGIVACEQSLPRPWVHYPGHYGAFFGFSTDPHGPIALCACTRPAIHNYLRFKSTLEDQFSDPELGFVMSPKQFPLRLVRECMTRSGQDAEHILASLTFVDGLCHECNRATPHHRYCHPMYGSAFKQAYGWYINRHAFEYGVMPVRCRILPDVCPDEVFALLDCGRSGFLEMYGHLSDREHLLTTL